MTTSLIDEQQPPEGRDEGPCSHASHAQARRSEASLRARTRVIGVQEDGLGGWVLLGNCRCGTTLGYELKGEMK